MKTATVARTSIPRKKLVFDPNMNSYTLCKIFEDMMKSTKGLTKGVFLEYYALYPKSINSSNLLCYFFENPKTFIVIHNNTEIRGATILRTSDGNGQYFIWLNTEKLLQEKWKKIYTQPCDVTLEKAFELAFSLRNKKGSIVLSKAVSCKHKSTLVGNTKESVTFAHFCEKLNTHCGV